MSPRAAPSGPAEPPELFRRALHTLRATDVRSDIVVREVTPPRKLAPYAAALAAELHSAGAPLADGRFVVLHDPAGQEGWTGPTRIVIFVRADVDPEMAADPFLPTVGWSWLCDALAQHGAAHAGAGGTVTRTSSNRFGTLAVDRESAEVEVRGSWSPIGTDLSAHLHAWCDLLCSIAGIPPPGVSALAPRRG